MAEFRWALLAAGIVILLGVFWWSRREAKGQSIKPPDILRRRLPGLSSEREASGPPAIATSSDGDQGAPLSEAQRVVTIRLTAHGHGTFAGEELILALREAGLRHGRFGIFHRHDPTDDGRIMFSVASLVEPGSFDLAGIRTERFPGVSLFLVLPGSGDPVAAFDNMLSTAREIATRLDGELLDEQGSRLSVQRERYLREELIRGQHKPAAS